MQSTELPLLQTQQSKTKVNNSSNEFTSQTLLINPFSVLDSSFNRIFSQNPEEKIVLQMRRVLGEKANTLSDEKVECLATEFQFLINAWLDEYERDVFEGMTLKEVLNEK
jgi:poly-beta-hydroxyalkanoate depolymerase